MPQGRCGWMWRRKKSDVPTRVRPPPPPNPGIAQRVAGRCAVYGTRTHLLSKRNYMFCLCIHFICAGLSNPSPSVRPRVFEIALFEHTYTS